MRWNKAFEKIGFKNAVQVRDFPTAKEDPQFDPDNLAYSCIRYIPNSDENAMGPSWVDPTTGEIINASVIVYNNIEDLLYKMALRADGQRRSHRACRLLAHRHLPTRSCLCHRSRSRSHARSRTQHGRLRRLRHRLAPQRRLTRKYGTTPSIMDYARFNYVAQPGDKGVHLTPPRAR